MNTEQHQQMDLVWLRMPSLFSKEILAHYIRCVIYVL